MELNLLFTYQKNWKIKKLSLRRESVQEIIQLHAVVWGRVQGVGFRVTARQCALKLGLKGTVANLDDGNVEIVAQGSRLQLDKFLKLLQEYFGSGYIARIDTKFEKPDQLFDNFIII